VRDIGAVMLPGKAALLGSVRTLCGSEHLADVCLVVGGRRMPAHRHVLGPHSRVFERMWSHSMSEVLSRTLSCTDPILPLSCHPPDHAVQPRCEAVVQCSTAGFCTFGTSSLF
jgi:hypothetical protein